MSSAGVAGRLKLEAWQGWARARADRSNPAGGAEHRLEMGAVSFTLPESQEAGRLDWVREPGWSCIFSGFLFNAQELERELELAPPPDGHSERGPARLILAGFRRWGRRVLERLEGMFVLAIWEETEQRLLCARDPVGLHPFYYAPVHGDLVFSWTVEAVRRHPLVSPDLNRLVLAEHMAQRWLVPEETCFEAIRRLPGGHALEWSQGRLEVFRYWDPLPVGRPMPWASREEVAEFPQVLERAIEQRLRLGPAGIFLSGGFDSVSVAAMAAEQARAKGWPAPLALSVVFPGEFSEQPVQQGVAERLGLPQSFRYMSDYQREGLMSRLTDLSDTPSPAPPFGLYTPPYTALLGEARERGYEFVLTGEGGDEWLTVSPLHGADLIRSGNLFGLIRLLRTGLRGWQVPTGAYLKEAVWVNGARAIARDWVWRKFPELSLRRRRQLLAEGLPSWLAPDPELRRQMLVRLEEKWARQTRQESFYLTSVRGAFSSTVLQILLEERFYRDASVGAFTIHPYWDRSVIEFLLRTPPEILNQGGRPKALVRQAMAERFPNLGFEKQKKVFALDFADAVFRAEGARVWEQLGVPRALAGLGVVDAGLLQDKIHQTLHWPHRISRQLVWMGASTEGWVRSQA